MEHASAAGPAYPRLLGGRLCLDFANSVDPRLATPAWDPLGSYADLVGWARYAGAIGEDDAARLLAAAAQRPAAAATVFAEAIALREAIYRLFAAVATGEEPVGDDLDHLAAAYRSALAAARLEPGADGYGWAWPEASDNLAAPLWPVVRSAVETLTEGDPRRIKRCLGTGECGWLFHDGSKNASRRWCSMEGCGSQVKSRRHYARTRG